MSVTVFVCACVCAHMCVYVCVHMCVCVHVRMHVRIYAVPAYLDAPANLLDCVLSSGDISVPVKTLSDGPGA
jgi:hypothetical protein